MIKTFFFLSLILTIEAWAQSNHFLLECEKDASLREHYESLFEIKGCNPIEKKLRSIVSVSEIINPDRKKSERTKILSSPWTDDFPHLYGLNLRILSNHFAKDPTGLGSDKTPNLGIFKEFANISDIAYLPEYTYFTKPSGICNVLKTLPSIKTVTVYASVLMNKKADECLSKLKDGVIIRGEFQGFNLTKHRSNIIGLEFFSGDLIRIGNLKNLRFLGISNKINMLDGIKALAKLSKLSHLSINIHSNSQNVEDISFLRDLEYLNITCTKTESLNRNTSDECENQSALKNIDFLREMTFLRHLNLSYNDVADLEKLGNLVDLEYLDMRGNKITNIPPLPKLEKLRYLDLAGNKINDLRNVENFKKLYFLNLSGNGIKSIDNLFQLNELKYLNLSNIPNLEPPKRFHLLPSLKVLNLNERRISNNLSDDLDFRKFEIKEYETEKKLIFNTLISDDSKQAEFNYNCVTTKSKRTSFPLDFFPNIEILSLRYNNLESIPETKNLHSLRYIDLEANNIDKLTSTSLPSNVEFVNLDINDFTELPRLDHLKKLRSISFSQNLISNLSNATFIPHSLKELGLHNNVIKDATDLREIKVADEFHFNISLINNIIPKDPLACPTGNSSNLEKACALYVKGETKAIGIQRSYLPDETIEELITRIKSYQCK